jgi:hypothetical protein
MTTNEALKALYESRDYHTALRNQARREGNHEEEAIEQATLDGITRAIDEYARKLKK